MSPRPAKSTSTEQLEPARFWLIQPVLEARWSGVGAFLPINLKEEFASSTAQIRSIDQRIKKLASYGSFDGLAAKLTEAFRLREPTPKQNPDLFKDAPMTAEDEMRWRKAQVIERVLDPVRALKAEEFEEHVSSKGDRATRRYHPHVEYYRDHISPLLDMVVSEETIQPEVLFDNPSLEVYYQKTGEAFDGFKQAIAGEPFKKHQEAHRRRVYNAEKSVKGYINALIDAHDGVCVMYLYFGHLTNLYPVGFSDIKTDFSKLLQNVTMNSFYSKPVGYIWKLERSATRHYHHHCFIFFRPEEAGRWEDLRDSLCRLWIDDITASRGIVYQHNYRENSRNNALLTPETPAIQHKEDATHQRLSAMLDALIRIDDLTYLDLPKGFRSLGRGQLPKSR